jgi:hypothetical protein
VNKQELLRRLVLNTICDDYENVDQTVFQNVSGCCARSGWAIERSDVVSTLSGLVAEGLAKAYCFVESQPVELPAMPPLSDDDFDFWFCITSSGMAYHLADNTWWPADDKTLPIEP